MTKLRLLHKTFLCYLLLLVYQLAWSQGGGKVTGRITDDKGNALTGATIRVKGATGGVTSGADGSFRLPLSSPGVRLVISYVGFELQELSAKAGAILSIALQPVDSRLNEVVVVGYETQKRKDVTGSIASVKGRPSRTCLSPM